MVKKKILITGGSGYIGSRLSLSLSQKGFDIIPLCNTKIPENTEWVQSMYLLLQGDLRDKSTLNNIQALRPDAIIHLVSLDHNQSGINIEETLQVNVQSTWELLNLSASIGLDRFIYFSTTQVYGQTSEGVLTENTELRPSSAYGLTHKMSEDLVKFYVRTKKLNAVSLRLSNSYGEPVFHDTNCWSLLINDLCLSAYVNKRIVLNSDGTAIRDFIHYSTICESVASLLSVSYLTRNTFNLSSGKSVNLISVAMLIKDIYEKRFLENIDIYINKTEKVNVSSSMMQQPINQISNESLHSLISVSETRLDFGILSLFDYFENTIR